MPAPRGWFKGATHPHQEFDRLSKGGDSLTGLLEGPNVFHALLTKPILLTNGA